MLIVDLVKIPVLVSLSVVETILVLSVLDSLWNSRTRKDVTPGH
jgi:hypothetical protein